MATRFIHRGLDAPDGVSKAAGFAFNRDDVLEARRDLDGAQVSGFVPLDRVVKKTASFTVTPADHGTTFILDSQTTIVATLPPTQAGLRFRFVVEQLGGHQVKPNAADGIFGSGLVGTDGQAAENTAATDAVGDLLEVTGDGELGWYVTGKIGTWAAPAS